MNYGLFSRHFYLACLPLLMFSLLLTACGDRAELPQKGFVMGIALDESDKGNIELTAQIFKPSQTVTSKGKVGKAYINIHTEDQSVFEAIRDITIHLGRKAQWSHMRAILVSEALARKFPLISLLEFFYRDHEPRLTSHVLITKGRASDYLNTPPYIESSVSQQYFLSEKASHELTGKTSTLNLLELALQARSESAVALIPYVYKDKIGSEETTNVAGSAVLAQGHVKEIVPVSLLEGILMLKDQYKIGIIEVPCKRNKPIVPTLQEDSLEMVKASSSMKLKLYGERPHLIFRIKAFVAISELVCGKVLMPNEELELRIRVQNTIKQRMGESLDWMLEKHLDLVGAGNALHERKPRLWKQWKSDWPMRFARSSYEVHADVTILTSGTNIGKPINSK
ncbi:Ger(x)C family spore germination protein [Cohnella silvisoli]|uniref:Ger(X)C family spore germination protein n=1 Tax=Cohnella silvisoli TaxID=2873699 RepID=A0ABV1KMD9_9BACL|nr:Ger(x)C family spore germination protein [Cohnella silvisoli]MCD9020466.1 Ger(x)C family spore germination protein [Cohnella silvisoli]